MLSFITTLWRMSLQTCALIIAILAIRPFLKKYPKIYSYSLWILVGISLLCPIMISSPFSLQPALQNFLQPSPQQNKDQKKEPDQSQENMSFQDPSATDSFLQNQNIENIPFQDHSSINYLSSSQDNFGGNPFETDYFLPSYIGKNGWDIRSYLLFQQINPSDANYKTIIFSLFCIIYITGIGAVSLYYLFQYWKIRRCTSYAVRDRGIIWFCDRIQSPFVMGIFHPKILVPYTLHDFEKQCILRHEITHIRHHDPFVRLIGLLCICLHWWNPFVWIAVHTMNQDMEMFCDECTLRYATFEERKFYARTLLAFSEKQNGFSIGLAFGESNTERRVKNIMKKRKHNFIIFFCVILLAAFCAGAFMTVPKTIGSESDTQNPEEKYPENNNKDENLSKTKDQLEENNRDFFENNPEYSPSAYSQKEKEEMLAAYSSILNDIYFNHTLPNGQPCPIFEDDKNYDMSQNNFAIFDIDFDGKDELIINFTNSYMAGRTTTIYGYNSTLGTVQEELLEFPTLTFYNNGIVMAFASHNHGLAATFPDFWPYGLYQYNADSDQYRQIASVTAWDRAQTETDDNNNPFPSKADLDGDGVIYFVYLIESDTTLTFDGTEFKQWEDSYIGGQNEISIPFQSIAKENRE